MSRFVSILEIKPQGNNDLVLTGNGGRKISHNNCSFPIEKHLRELPCISSSIRIQYRSAEGDAL